MIMVVDIRFIIFGTEKELCVELIQNLFQKLQCNIPELNRYLPQKSRNVSSMEIHKNELDDAYETVLYTCHPHWLVEFSSSSFFSSLLLFFSFLCCFVECPENTFFMQALLCSLQCYNSHFVNFRVSNTVLAICQPCLLSTGNSQVLHLQWIFAFTSE